MLLLNYIKFTDWQELGLKKDIEKIAKSLEQKETAIITFVWDNLCFFAGFIISCYFEDINSKMVVFYICLFFAIVPTIIFLVHIGFAYFKKIKSASQGILNISDKIDIFDNKICCLTMMSTSYVDMLATSYNSISQSEKIFLYQEINYYINKSIAEIYAMQPIAKKIFSNNYDEVKSKRLISLSRLYTIIEILEQSRPITQIDASEGKVKILLNQSNSDEPIEIEIEITPQVEEIIEFQNSVNNKHQENLNTFKDVIAAHFSNQNFF